MDFSSYSLDDSFQDFSLDLTTYQGQLPFADPDPIDGHTADKDRIDAELLNLSFSWNHPAMQRFLNDKHQPMLFSKIPHAHMPGFGAPVTAMPPAATFYFHDSPPPSHEQSSCTSSSVRSPRADTDMFTENAPSTPSDMSFVSSLPAAPFDPFDLNAQQLFTGMGGCRGNAITGVSMAEINPAEDTENEWAELPPVVDFNPGPQRSYTLSSQSSMSFEMDAIRNQVPADNSYHSPGATTLTKPAPNRMQSTSIIDVTTKAPYPTPSIGESEDSGVEDVSTPIFGEEEEEEEEEEEKEEEEEEDDDDDDDDAHDNEDDEYQPVSRQKSVVTARQTMKNKRSSPTVPLDKMSSKRPRTIPAALQIARPLPTSSGHRTTFPCRECLASFRDENGLQNHVKKAHTRPFICVFRFAGCQSTFASKNEWKRHVMSQHLVLTYWLCDIDNCAHNSNVPSASSRSNGGRGRGTKRTSERMITLEPMGPPLPNGAIFNRKDLYTQHLRRMHTPPNIKKASNKTCKANAAAIGAESTSSEWEDQIKTHQCHAHRERCKLPTQMQCPANNCDQAFSGTDAWDQRMEHVAKHLDKAAAGVEDPVMFGGPTDPSLMKWVTSPDVAVVREIDVGKWILNNPLRAAGEGRGVGRRRDVPSTAAIAPVPMVGTSRVMSLAFPTSSASSPAFDASEVGEIEVEEENGDEDAEGEEEY